MRKPLRYLRRHLFSSPSQSARSMIRLSPRGTIKGRALLAFSTVAYKRIMRGEKLDRAHPAAWTNLLLAGDLLARGFRVDVIDFLDQAITPAEKYEVIIDVGTNLDRLGSNLVAGGIGIYYTMFNHPIPHNAACWSRHSALLRRRGVSLLPERLRPYSLAAEVADHVICPGGTVSLENYGHIGGRLHSLTQVRPFVTEKLVQRNVETSRRRFLWLGGNGPVQKGLDVTLEAFAGMPECELYICGSLENWPGFIATYGREIQGTPNIRNVGWVDTTSDRWSDVANQCIGFVAPSATEVRATSAYVCMSRGLVPIVTRELDVDIGPCGVVLGDPSPQTIQDAVRSVAAKDRQSLREWAEQAMEAGEQAYDRARAAADYTAILDGVLSAHPRAEEVAGSGELKVADIRRIAVG